jgi:hypothetical protein
MVLRFEPPLYESAPPFFYVLWKKPLAVSYVIDPEGRGFGPAFMLRETKAPAPEALLFNPLRVFSWMGSGT